MNSPRVALPSPRFTLVGEGRTTLRLRATKLLNEDTRAETLRKASIAAKHLSERENLAILTRT